MIPLYPPNSTAHAFHTPKWRSLVQLVSRSTSAVDLRTLGEQPRTRSLSAIVFTSPASRKASRSSLDAAEGGELGRRRPSAPSLTELRRFLPSLLHHRSRSSSNVDAAGGPQEAASSAHPRADFPSGGAKGRVKKAKANREPAQPPSAAHRPNVFQKQGQKPRKQSDCAPPDGRSPLIHGGDAQREQTDGQSTPTEETADPRARLVPADASAHSSAEDLHASPIASLPATPASSSQTVPKVAKKKSAGISSLIHVFHRKRSQPSKQPAASSDDRKLSTGKPTGRPSFVFSDRTLHCSFQLTDCSHPAFFLSPSTASLTPKDESLPRPAASAAPQPLQRLRHARTAFNFGPQHKQLLTAALALRYKRNSFPPNSRAASDPRPLLPVATRCLHDVHSSLGFLRRHTIPDMTVAAYGMVICGTDELQHRYRGRIEKVKFGVPISEAFSHDIPATLLVLLLKVNKEGPLKKDIWRAPGNQAQVRKLSHIMQHGRLVNISHISVYTAASVIKKFLSKLPGGIFGPENEKQLFETMQSPDSETQRQVFCRVICSLSVPSQHLLVLLFGTFRIIADSAETFNTRMGPDAIGISVAPSLFHTCIHDQRQAKMEDVLRFKTASQVISKIIQGFGYTNLFPRECYEFYARITGRTLRVDADWRFSFQYPTRTFSQPSICFEGGREEGGEAEEDPDRPGPSGFVASRSQPTGGAGSSASTGAIERRRSSHPEVAASDGDDEEEADVYSEALPGPSRSQGRWPRGRAASSGMAGGSGGSSGGYSDLLAEQHRLSTSMGEVLIHERSGEPSPNAPTRMSMGADSSESTRSLTYLEWVHEKQTRRMRTRSEWFLSPAMPGRNKGASRSFDFHQDYDVKTRVSTSSPSPSPVRHLHLAAEDAEMRSSTEEMRSQSCTSSQSHASSAKEQRPHSPPPPLSIVKPPAVLTAATGETTPRLPFQLLQHQSGEDDDAPLSATPPARQHAPVFFPDDVVEPPAKTSKSSSSSSGNGGSQKSVLVAPSTLARVSSIGVVRRKSFRTHYTRPNKSLDVEPPPKEEVGATSQSTPIRGSVSASSTRRGSANGGGAAASSTAETSRTLLMRRKSSGSSAQAKMPVQARHSTQI